MRNIIFASLLIVLFCAQIGPAQDFQSEIIYNGKFVDSDGNPVADGKYILKVKIYDEEVDGNIVWTENNLTVFEVMDGKFEHTLGLDNPLPTSLSDYESLWVAFKIDHLDELVQRNKLESDKANIYTFTIPTKTKENSGEITIFRFISSGETYKVIYAGQEIFMKLIGIDSPKRSSHPSAKKYSASKGISLSEVYKQGAESISFVKSLISVGDTLFINFDTAKKDDKGRLLVYAYTSDGLFLNEKIVKAGYAEFVSDPLNTKFDEKLLEAENYAKENKLGHWAEPAAE